LGIFKEVAPEMVATATAKPAVYEGHPFLVEAGVSIGGKDVKPVMDPATTPFSN
jgi:DNA topoisomerase-6 subunit B